MTSAASVELQLLTGDADLIEATVAAEAPTQGRVRFGVTVRNVTGYDLVVTNPYEGLTYQLISGSGTPIQVNAPPSAAKVHVRRDPAAKLAYLELSSVVVGGDTVDPGDALRAPTFDIAPGTSADFRLAVSSSIDLADRATLDYVGAGEHQLVVMLRLVVNLGEERHPLQFRTAHGVDVTVL